MNFTLTRDELKSVTGVSRADAQLRWLHDRGWKHELDYYGRPVVAREYAEKMLGVTKPNKRKVRPNFAALQEAS